MVSLDSNQGQAQAHYGTARSLPDVPRVFQDAVTRFIKGLGFRVTQHSDEAGFLGARFGLLLQGSGFRSWGLKFCDLQTRRQAVGQQPQSQHNH